MKLGFFILLPRLDILGPKSSLPLSDIVLHNQYCLKSQKEQFIFPTVLPFWVEQHYTRGSHHEKERLPFEKFLCGGEGGGSRQLLFYWPVELKSGRGIIMQARVKVTFIKKKNSKIRQRLLMMASLGQDTHFILVLSPECLAVNSPSISIVTLRVLQICIGAFGEFYIRRQQHIEHKFPFSTCWATKCPGNLPGYLHIWKVKGQGELHRMFGGTLYN